MTSNSNVPEESAPFDKEMVARSIVKLRQMGRSWETISQLTGRTIEWLQTTQGASDDS